MEIGQFDHRALYRQGHRRVQVDGWVYAAGLSLAGRALHGLRLVAQQMERDPDGLWVRFYLNPKARFADGTPSPPKTCATPSTC
jgi:microcin C transport system substrate-binding protein